MIEPMAFETDGGTPFDFLNRLGQAAAMGCVGVALAAFPAMASDSGRPYDMGREAGFAAIAPEYEPALLIAVRVALNKADLTYWASDDGRAGYVTVSAPRIRGPWECRVYRYMVAQDGRDWLSPDRLACRDDPSAGWDLQAGVGW